MLNCWFSWKPDIDDRYIIGKVFPFEEFDAVSTDMVRRNFDDMETVYLHIVDTDKNDHNTDFMVTVSSPLMPICGIDSRVAATLNCRDFDPTNKIDIAAECHAMLKKCIKTTAEVTIKSVILEYCNQSDGYLSPEDITHAFYSVCNDIDSSYNSFRRVADEMNKA